jgi:hypothetical protein
MGHKVKVDTHVLLMPDTHQRWWEECKASLREEPINLHETPGVKGHIGKARANGFRQGTAPYVSCIDPDDLVIPGAFQACIDALEARPDACGAFTDELLVDINGRTIKPGIWSREPWNPLLQLEPKYLHHIYVMRRSYVEPYLNELEDKWPSLADFILKGLICKHGPWIHVDRFGYKWRIHRTNNHKDFPIKDVYAARWRVIPTLYEAAIKYQARLATPAAAQQSTS